MKNKIWIVKVLVLFISLCTQSCKNNVLENQISSNSIGSLLMDNQGFQEIKKVLNLSGRMKELVGTEKRTVLAFTDDTYLTTYLTGGMEELTYGFEKAPAEFIRRIADFNILLDDHDFLALPLKKEQAIAVDGNKNFIISRSIVSGDTLTTINGARVVNVLKGSNGTVYVLDKVFFGNEDYAHVSEGLASQKALTLFNYAAQVTGMKSFLANGSSYFTVLAPSNDAMAMVGYPDFASIDIADKDKLVYFIKSHIISDRKYLIDIELELVPYTKPFPVETLSGTIIYGDLRTFYDTADNRKGFCIIGEDFNEYDLAKLMQRDILCKNGLVNIVNMALIKP